MASGRTINPTRYQPQVAARNAYKAANKTATSARNDQARAIFKATLGKGQAGAADRRAQMKALNSSFNAARKTRVGDFRTTTRSNWVAAGKPGQVAPAPGTFTNASANKAVVKPPSAATVSNTKQLLRRANGRGRNAAKQQFAPIGAGSGID